MTSSHTPAACASCSVYPHALTQFLETVRQEYARINLPAPANLVNLRYTDLVYTARHQAVVKATLGVGFAFTQEEFNHIVNGRLDVRSAHLFICQTIAAKPKPVQLLRIEEKS